MFLRQIKESAMANMTYVVAEGESGHGVVIDPSGDVIRIMKVIESVGIKVDYVLNTHGHSDHTSGNGRIVKDTGAKVAAHKLANVKKDVSLEDGQILKVGTLSIKVIHTPGHTKDSVCFLIESKLFTGDTLFVGECGRTDMPGGDAPAMYESLFNRLMKLPDEIEVFPGHDYGPRPTSTIGNERKNNYVLLPRSKEEFIEFMAEP
jgi:glyoxylase-like metal-dependent hydrolase (beta-lactamase superfamily II)